MVALEISDFTDLKDDEAKGPRSSLFYYCRQWDSDPKGLIFLQA